MEMSNIFLNDVKADKVYVNVDKLECFVPKRYAANNRLILGDKIDVLGIFNMLVNGTEKRGLCIPAMIACSPSDVLCYPLRKVMYLVTPVCYCKIHS